MLDLGANKESNENIKKIYSLYEKFNEHGIENFFGYLLLDKAEKEKNKDLSKSVKTV